MTDAHLLITENIDIWTTAIKKRSATGRGSNKKIELTGIKKLRELILELAVRGKLVPQGSNDEPASVLLEKIAAEKAQLIKDKKIKKTKALPDIVEDEKLFELPSGWEWSRLGFITEIGPRNNLDDDIQVSFVPMPLITTNYDGSHGQEIRKWSEIKKGYTHFSNGDIALAKITPCFENSKAAVFTGLKNGYGSGTTELHVARPFGETLNRLFILLYLKAPQFLQVGKTKMTGSAGQKRVPTDFFKGNPIPFPPLAEQHRIVEKADELMRLCDQLEQQTEDSITAHQTLVKTLLATLSNSENPAVFKQNWTRIAEHFDTLFTTEHSIDQLKQTILQLAVMGKLVPQNPNDEPAPVLLEKIAAEKKQLIKDKKIKKQKPLPAISEDEKPFALPIGWEWCRLAEIASFENGDRSSRYPNQNDHVEKGIPFFGAKDMVDGILKFDNDLRYITKEKFSELSNGKLCDKDFVILLRGTVGKTAQFKRNNAFFTGFINAQMLIIRLHQTTLDNFLNTFFISRFFQQSIDVKITGSAIKQMPASVLNNLLIPLAPQCEQLRITSKVDELMTLCDQLEARLNEAQISQLHLADTIVEQAVI